MVKEGAEHEAEDKKRRDQVETRNKADQLCYSVEKALSEVKGKLPADKVASIESQVKSLRSAIEKEDHDAIKSGMESLEKAMSEVASMAYGAGGGPGGGDAPPPGAAGGKKAGDVIDAEFEETN
jgi:molecular chaperone DnaK